VSIRWSRIPGFLLLAVLLLTLITPARAADPGGLCSKIHPLINGGYSTVLGFYAEGGIRCPSSRWTLQLGWRWTQLEEATNPFIVLTYDTPLSPEWHLSVTGSQREHLGDYEVNRLPEANLLWEPVSPKSFIIPTIDFSAGWFATVLPLEAQTSRTGTVLTISTQPIHISRITLSAIYQLGDYFYGTGKSSSYWLSALSTNMPLSPSIAIGLSYVHQEGFGVSPLVYDSVNYDNFAWAQFTDMLTPKVTLTFATQFNIAVPGYSGPVREYTFSYNKVSEGWSIGVGWYVPTNQPFLFGTLPQF